MHEFNCRDFRDSIDFYITHTLERGDLIAFESHRDQCESCARLFTQAHILDCVFKIYINQPIKTEIDETQKQALFRSIIQRAELIVEREDQLLDQALSLYVHAPVEVDEQEKQEIFNSIMQRVQSFEREREEVSPLTAIKEWFSLYFHKTWALPVGFTIAALLFLSTTGFKSPLIDFVVSSHEQQWPTEIETSQLTQVKEWFSKNSTQDHPLVIPQFERLPNAEVKLEMARLSLVMVGPQKWERAAHLLYTLAKGQKVTVLAFNQTEENTLEGDIHTLHNVNVSLTESGSLNVAHYSKSGLSYIVTSDLHKQELLKLISTDLVNQ